MDKIEFLKKQMNYIAKTGGDISCLGMCCFNCPIDKYSEFCCLSVHGSALDAWMFLNLLLEIEYQGE